MFHIMNLGCVYTNLVESGWTELWTLNKFWTNLKFVWVVLNAVWDLWCEPNNQTLGCLKEVFSDCLQINSDHNWSKPHPHQITASTLSASNFLIWYLKEKLASCAWQNVQKGTNMNARSLKKMPSENIGKKNISQFFKKPQRWWMSSYSSKRIKQNGLNRRVEQCCIKVKKLHQHYINTHCVA